MLAVATAVEIRSAAVAGIPEADPFTGGELNGSIACKAAHGGITL
jgi:hypothetical protein